MIEEYREKCVACCDWIDFEDKDHILGIEEGICGMCAQKGYNLKEGEGRLYPSEIIAINQKVVAKTHALVLVYGYDGPSGVFTSIEEVLKAVTNPPAGTDGKVPDDAWVEWDGNTRLRLYTLTPVGRRNQLWDWVLLCPINQYMR